MITLSRFRSKQCCSQVFILVKIKCALLVLDLRVLLAHRLIWHYGKLGLFGMSFGILI